MERNKIKVVWLCYFTNEFLQNILNPKKNVNEIAPWITNSIRLFEEDKEIELHVISQHEWIKGVKSFKCKGITYHLYNAGIPFIGRHWPSFFRLDLFTDFFIVKFRIKKLIKQICPDIIHLRGAENEFSTVITQFYNKYPVFITIQGFVHKSLEKSYSTKLRSKKELQILKMFKHFGYSNLTMCNDILNLNPNAILHWHDTPIEIPTLIEVEKKYDIVFFARVCKTKGIEDLLKAVSILKKVKEDISLCIIGGGRIDDWKKKAFELNISENVYWAGFLLTQKDVHNLASSARISVLPTYQDMIPGTIIESMFLKIPVISYNVGSIHEINTSNEIVTLIDKFDINGLSKAIIKLLKDENLQKEKSELGYKRAFEMISDNSTIKEDILKAYNIVIEDYLKENIYFR